ncbi:hypothetical protein [Nocardia miyunensis]|uniref:hypothetical protein n=1 Tax=Nocardia miyunensis TaxID=282684 RepID=UPI0008343DB0|nr:hypothetical protein [Nocardia miyunensis]
MSTSQLESEVAQTDPDSTVTENSEADESESDESESDEIVSEETGSDEVPGQGGTRRWIVRACAALIVVIAIVSSVFAGIFGWKLRERGEVDAAARRALSTAQTYAVTLTSIDSQHIADDYDHVLAGATGDFKNMYSQSSGQLKKMLIDNKARSVGKVVDASVQSASTEQVVVMLFVDQEITNNVSPDPRVDRSRIIMTMQSVGGRWLAAKVEMA